MSNALQTGGDDIKSQLHPKLGEHQEKAVSSTYCKDAALSDQGAIKINSNNVSSRSQRNYQLASDTAKTRRDPFQLARAIF
jgi:hypothetical protein